MKEAKNIKICKKLISDLEKKQYFSAALKAYNDKYSDIVNNLVDEGTDEKIASANAYKLVLSHLHDIMRSAEPLVEEVITQRIQKGQIKDASQARKSVAGNLFQQFIAYSLAKNIVVKNISKNVIVTLSASILEQYAIIKVGEDEQKPDSDVLVYSDENKTSPIINFSCKTSCRERAGQTYKWKLLSDLATCTCIHQKDNENCPITKYGLEYNPQRKIYMCFITADFYDELKNPQISAMFNFFDNSYVAKPQKPSDKIKLLQDVIDDINTYY